MEGNPIITKDGRVVNQDGLELTPGQYKLVLVRTDRRKMKEKDWLMLYQASLTNLAKDRDIRGEPRSILDFLMANMDFENYIAIDQKHIATELGIHKVNVSKAIKLLVEKNILKKGPKVGRSNTYILNSDYAWKGQVEKKREAKIVDIAKARRDYFNK